MTTTVEIVSPEKLLLSREATMAVIPGSEGEIGVLPGHAPMIVTLRGGTIKLFKDGQVTDTLFVAGGFAEITAQRCTVLADEAVPVADLSRADAQRQRDEAQTALDQVDKMDIVAINRAIENLQVAESRVQAASA